MPRVCGIVAFYGVGVTVGLGISGNRAWVCLGYRV